MNLEVLKKAKKEKRMTLQEISDKSGIPKRTVDQIFSGKTTNPRIDTVQAIERALGLGGGSRALGCRKCRKTSRARPRLWAPKTPKTLLSFRPFLSECAAGSIRPNRPVNQMQGNRPTPRVFENFPPPIPERAFRYADVQTHP